MEFIMTKKELTKYSILIFLCLLWGTTWIAIKYTLEGIPPFLRASLLRPYSC